MAASPYAGDDHDSDSCFVSLSDAARILEISTTRVGQLAAAGRLPYVETGLAQSRRLYRRAPARGDGQRAPRVPTRRHCQPAEQLTPEDRRVLEERMKSVGDREAFITLEEHEAAAGSGGWDRSKPLLLSTRT